MKGLFSKFFAVLFFFGLSNSMFGAESAAQPVANETWSTYDWSQANIRYTDLYGKFLKAQTRTPEVIAELEKLVDDINVQYPKRGESIKKQAYMANFAPEKIAGVKSQINKLKPVSGFKILKNTALLAAIPTAYMLTTDEVKAYLKSLVLNAKSVVTNNPKMSIGLATTAVIAFVLYNIMPSKMQKYIATKITELLKSKKFAVGALIIAIPTLVVTIAKPFISQLIKSGAITLQSLFGDIKKFIGSISIKDSRLINAITGNKYINNKYTLVATTIALSFALAVIVYKYVLPTAISDKIAAFGSWIWANKGNIVVITGTMAALFGGAYYLMKNKKSEYKPQSYPATALNA